MAPRFNPELEQLFRGVEKDLPGINWPAIVAVGSSVSSVYLSRTGPLTLGWAFPAWFTCGGAPVCHDGNRLAEYPGMHKRFPEKGDLAVTIDQAAKTNFNHPWKFEDRINRHRPSGRVELQLPAYDVERGYLLLDGNHRSIATLCAGVEYKIELVVIHGPIDRRVLADLAVFE
jgi:hypothetical protein